MRTYFIKYYRTEEKDYIIKVLSEYGIENREGLFDTVTFDCEKSVWKQIKKKLNSKITAVHASIKMGA